MITALQSPVCFPVAYIFVLHGNFQETLKLLELKNTEINNTNKHFEEVGKSIV